MSNPVSISGDGVSESVMSTGDIIVKATPTSVARLQ